MSWITSRQFKISNRNGRHYVFHRNNAGNTEVNIPASITTKAAAAQWLRAHPNAPKRTKAARKKANSFKYGPFNKYPSPKKPSPSGFIRQWNTKERKNFAKYLAKRPFSSSPKYSPESPTMRLLRRAALKSEGQKVSPSPLKAPSPPKSKFSCSGKKLTKIIGKGRQGIIYEGVGFAAKVCPRDLRAARHREKQPAKVEFDIQQAAHTAAPNGVVDVFWIEKCKNFIPPSAMNMANVQDSKAYDKSEQTVIFMEYCSGGSLSGWLNEKPRSEAMIHNVIKSVVTTIAKIQKDYPDFRHNDLHLDNVLVADRGFLIGDFGWSRIKKTGTNPAVNTANKTGIAGQWGVGPKTDPRYDHHMFLNNLRSWVVNKGGFAATRAFLDVAVPPGYRGATDLHVQEWRLKYGDPCADLPSLSQILKSKYISGRKFSSPNLLAAKAKLRKVLIPRVKRITSANLRAAKAKLRKYSKRIRISPRSLRRAKNRLKPARPRAKITASMLKARKSKLKEGKKTTKRITAAMLKNKKFDKLVEYIWRNNGAKSGKNYNNAWANARHKAVRLVELRMNRGNAPFSPNPRSMGQSVKVPVPRRPSPPRKPSPPRNASPPKNLAAAAKRLRNAAAKLAANRVKSKVLIVAPKKANIGRRVGANFQVSPGSKRMKIRAPNSGRLVYADGSAITMQYLKNLAARRGVNIKGIRAKNAIARKIFS